MKFDSKAASDWFASYNKQRIDIGFSGTRHGMTLRQNGALTELVMHLSVAWLHHGDCIGADAQMHRIVRKYCNGAAVHSWPCVAVGHPARACMHAERVESPKPPLVRNRLIVDHSQLLFATPQTRDEHVRSGTWATVRYAFEQHKPGFIVYPDGTYQWITDLEMK